MTAAAICAKFCCAPLLDLPNVSSHMTMKSPMFSKAIFVLIALLFFLTGATGLVYQVVWQRYLLSLFGATIYSISTVLAAFMGGLALGSFLFGRVADRSRWPLGLYGVLEIGVGLAALAVPWMLRILDPVFVAVYQNYGSNFFLYSLLRFVFVFLVLLVPTTLMGGTLPLLAKFAAPDGSHAGFRVGFLYALNTCGAVVGTIASGFFFIRWWGISASVLLAVAINVGVGIVALLLSRIALHRSSEGAPNTNVTPVRTVDVPPASRAWILAAYMLSGFCALGLEVVWSRSLVFTFELLKNTTYSFTAMLAVFLIGIATGSAVAAPWAEREREPYRAFSALQILVGFTAVISFFVLYYIAPNLGATWTALVDPEKGSVRWTQTLALVFLRSFVVVFPPTFVMGLAFPFAVRCIMSLSAPEEIGASIGKLYALNTVGAIVGAFVTGFFVLPGIGIAHTIWVYGAAQLLMGLVLLWRMPVQQDVRRIAWTIVSLAAVALTLLRIPRPTVFQPLEPREQLLFYKEGPLATVAVTENSLGYRSIFVDNVNVAGTEPIMLTDQKSLAHVPMLIVDEPRSALTVGFGSGGASYSYTLHPELERIDCVEITKTVTEAAPFLVASNHDVIMYEPEYVARVGRKPSGHPLWDDEGRSGWYKADPRYRIILDDVRSYLHFTGTKYDIIATDCTDLRYKSNANLYDLEYFELTRDHLTENGMVVVWMPLAGLSTEAFKVALRTFYKVFPNMEVFYMNNEPTHYVLLIGTREPLKVDLQRMRKRLANPRVAADLREIHLDSAEKILSCFVCGREALRNYLAGETLNTQDFPYLEFESPRFGYGDAPILMNIESLMAFRESPRRILREGTYSNEDLENLQRYVDAVPDIIAGHVHYRKLELEEALRCWQRARERNPADSAVANLLNFEELRRKVLGQPDNLWARYMYGRLLALQRRDSEAVSVLNDLVKDCRNNPPAGPAVTFYQKALEELASLYERHGRQDRAESLRQEAKQLTVRAPQ
ncbi:MAG: hypothetical protein D6691_06170 [Candidatus Hydrogenedentota bacterium]|nr:MAG: hypothetical protein D6691_06170 [Candidatus Hydrogenedentota bacterium]